MNVHLVWARSFLLFPLLPLMSSARLVSGPESPMQNFPVQRDKYMISSSELSGRVDNRKAAADLTVGVDDFDLTVHPILQDVRVT